MASLRFEQWVPFPLEKVFLFFADPRNLPRIMPSNTRTKIVELKLAPLSGAAPDLAGPGTEVVTSFRPIPFLPIRARWIALIMELEWNHHFMDIQKKGPFKSWHHRHEFSADTRHGVNGTVVRDVIDYEVGFGFVGKIADRFVRRTFAQMFAYRHSALGKLLE